MTLPKRIHSAHKPGDTLHRFGAARLLQLLQGTVCASAVLPIDHSGVADRKSNQSGSPLIPCSRISLR